jgi:acetyltransferase-like isoleucine patch superfamily enzyme
MFDNLTVIDLFRKIILVASNYRISFRNKFRVLVYFKSGEIRLGKNVSLIGICNKLSIGNDINIYNNCIFELGRNSNLVIGDRVIFSFGCLVSINQSLQIGNFVQVGEYTSIRDTTHDYKDHSVNIMENSDISESIVIGNNVWIGRNCLIMPGAIIEDGVVVGANSLVKGHLISNYIYAGNPLRKIRRRPQTNAVEI